MFLRVGAPLLLVAYSLTWVSFIRAIATATSFYVAPAMPTYLGALVGMELALAAELLTFVAVATSLRLFL